jgi:carboxylesterase type B
MSIAAKRHNAPVGIFVHGGAWRNGSAFEAAYLAEPFVHAGAHFVALDFINVAGCPVFSVELSCDRLRIR